ncbi:hypothetical protein FPRO05_10841 [Fusarium proliferatum]|uniref:Uncharacterized protein n=1 Tax=Gibberella intermedia TaxID=948311 RepID=A0A365NDB7_GIBIN|nr:hypothetical protein FPRO05_10841 [Fusarium proliferatum]
MALFKSTCISSDITPENALAFYREHGIYYQENATIGSLAKSLGGQALTRDGMSEFFKLVEKDERAHRIVQPFLAGSLRFWFTLGADPGKFYASTIDTDQDDKIVIYMWHPATSLEFSHKSHIGANKGAGSSNGLVHIPYSFLKHVKKLEEHLVEMETGGLLIVHPRLAFMVSRGLATGYVFQSTQTGSQTPS